jgi:hypothetical protein
MCVTTSAHGRTQDNRRLQGERDRATWEDLDSCDRCRRHARLDRGQPGGSGSRSSSSTSRAPRRWWRRRSPIRFPHPALDVALLAKEPHIEATLKTLEGRGSTSTTSTTTGRTPGSATLRAERAATLRRHRPNNPKIPPQRTGHRLSAGAQSLLRRGRAPMGLLQPAPQYVGVRVVHTTIAKGGPTGITQACNGV